MYERITHQEIAFLRRRQWMGRHRGAMLARCSGTEFDQRCEKRQYGPDPTHPQRFLIAQSRLHDTPSSPYLDALVHDYILTAGARIPEVDDWASKNSDLKIEHYPTLLEAVVRAVELGVFVALINNDVLNGRSALTGAGIVARYRFPDAALRVLGNELPPDVVTHGWLSLPPDLADLHLDELRHQFLQQFGRVRPAT